MNRDDQMMPIDTSYRVAERAALYRRRSPAFAHWAAGYGVLTHDDLTQVRIHELAELFRLRGQVASCDDVFRRLAAADRLANMGMWLVVHSTYAAHVHLDGRDLGAGDFRKDPEGHTGGSLNMVPAYVGYLVANALTGVTRAWLMGQGHCVAAIDAVNLLVGNLTPEHAARYDLSDAGLTRFVRDFYSYSLDSPRGSHVNAHTGGGVIEGGYLGFAELEYVHMPLPGERLVAFLSDGAFEEQRGSDWAPRWWRAEDTGLVAPILIANGRRIDQRSTIAQEGGTEPFRRHLELHGFDPLIIDGRDPAAFAWAICEMEERLGASARAVAAGQLRYPVPLPYAVAETIKGYGFPGAGTNDAHNLPLGTNPAVDEAARAAFNRGARQLWVPQGELSEAIRALSDHAEQKRPRERDHALMRREVPAATLPEPPWREVGGSGGGSASPMGGLDHYFTAIVKANPALRPRVGNPDELRSNSMGHTLDLLKHRVTAPEPEVAEAVDGQVITALNEEAVICATLGNKGGINLVVSYEAFAVKMLGAIRQELIFARHQREAKVPPGWLAVPVVVTSHTWENGKNEQSHQDPTLCEALLGEMTDVSRVLFPADWNSALAALEAAYRARGEIWTLVIPKRAQPDRFGAAEARVLMRDGALRMRGGGGADERVQLVAVGAYQLGEALRASERLEARGVAHSVVYLMDPGRFRVPRDEEEAEVMAARSVREQLFPMTVGVRVILTHTRPEPMLGLLRPLDTGVGRTRALGYRNRGGTLDVGGMLYVNRTTWAHALVAVAEGLGTAPGEWLSAEELAAVRGEGQPACLR